MYWQKKDYLAAMVYCRAWMDNSRFDGDMEPWKTYQTLYYGFRILWARKQEG